MSVNLALRMKQPDDQLAKVCGEIRSYLLASAQNRETGDPSPQVVDLMIQALDIISQRGGDPYIYLMNTMKLLAAAGVIMLSHEQIETLMFEVFIPDLVEA